MTPEERESDEYVAAERLCSIRHAAIEERLDAMWARIDDRFDAQERATTKAMEVASTAADKAENLATVRAMQQNEFRQTINDLIATRISRDEYSVQHQVLAEKAETNAKNIEREMSLIRERSNSGRIQTLILTGLMTAVFSMLVYLLFIHIK